MCDLVETASVFDLKGDFPLGLFEFAAFLTDEYVNFEGRSERERTRANGSSYG